MRATRALPAVRPRPHPLDLPAWGNIPSPGGSPPTIGDPGARARPQLLRFAEAIDATRACSPSKLCAYLFDLATTFTTFYEHCPVLAAPDDETRHRPLVLGDLTARVLEQGLSLLGMEAPEHM